MRVFILVYGTRGDLQPCVALAHALDRAGHQVVLAGPASFHSWVTSYGVSFAPLDTGLTRLWDNPQMHAAVRDGVRGVPGLRALAEAFRRPAIPSLRKILDQAWKAASGADLVVHSSPLLATASWYIAEKLDVPLVLNQMYPFFAPTGSFPVPLYCFPLQERFPAWLNRGTYKAFRRMLANITGREVEIWRRDDLGITGRGRPDVVGRSDGRPVPVLTAVSSHVLPRPKDWPDFARMTGYWFLPKLPDWTPSQELSDFLAAGEPPVYVGFGSVISGDLARVQESVVEAVHRLGVRAILAGPQEWRRSAASPDALFLDGAPHDWLFPQVAAVLHHGGHGTTGAAIAAGRPQIICSFMADQPFWGQLTKRLGVAPAPLLSSTATSASFGEALQKAVRDSNLRDRAVEIGRRVRCEDGLGAAVAAIEEIQKAG